MFDNKDPKNELSDSNAQKGVEEPPSKRILEASLQLFVEQGYFNTNVPDISKRSRCSIGSIYHHFVNKEEIAAQLYRDGIYMFRSALSLAIDPQADLEIVIKKIVESFLLFAEEHQIITRYLWLTRHEEFLSSAKTRPTIVGFDSFGRRLTKVVKSGMRSGQISKLKADVIWSIVFGIPLSFIRDWLEGFTEQTPSQVVPVLTTACWAALKAAR